MPERGKREAPRPCEQLQIEDIHTQAVIPGPISAPTTGNLIVHTGYRTLRVEPRTTISNPMSTIEPATGLPAMRSSRSSAARAPSV